MCPLVKIDIVEGKSTEYKNAVLNGVHKAIIETFNIPETELLQRLYELPFNNFEYPSDRTVNATIIEISMFPGRSLKIKMELYQRIINNLEKNPGIKGNDVIIILQEPPLENWSIRGGKPVSGVEFDF